MLFTKFCIIILSLELVYCGTRTPACFPNFDLKMCITYKTSYLSSYCDVMFVSLVLHTLYSKQHVILSFFFNNKNCHSQLYQHFNIPFRTLNVIKISYKYLRKTKAWHFNMGYQYFNLLYFALNFIKKKY